MQSSTSSISSRAPLSRETVAPISHPLHLRSKLKPITKEARELHTNISRTCLLADSVSKKVRDLDTTRERVRTTMRKVEDIVDVRNCIDGVGKALAQERYEEAAGASDLARGLHRC